jgi:hypothetical protein
VDGPWEHDNEPSGSIKCWKILEWLRNWCLLKKVSASWSYAAGSAQCVCLSRVCSQFPKRPELEAYCLILSCSAVKNVKCIASTFSLRFMTWFLGTGINLITY